MGDGAVSLVLRDVEVEGRAGQCVEVSGDTVTYVGPPEGRRAGARRAAVVDGRGGALLPGLHDHHLHLLALAARRRSVACGPPEVTGPDGLGAALRAAAAARRPGEWVRAVGHDDTVTGPLDARSLDDLLGPLADRPVRVQHRSGQRWVLNSAALEAARRSLGPAGLEALGHGAARGLLVGADVALRAAWAGDAWPPLDGVGADLARSGVTGVTDASVATGPEEVAFIARAQAAGALAQRVRVLGTAAPEAGGRISRGPAKLVLTDGRLPGLDELVAEVAAIGGRGVALHCVTRESLVLAAVALGRAGGGGHRIEHASVAPPDVVALLAPLGVTVVTQPGFVAAHGDRYLAEVDADDRPWLYRLAGWSSAGVALAGSTDGPFGPLDPWGAARAAVTRTTASGALVGPAEALSPERAVGLFLGPLEDPGGPARRVAAGRPADLCLLWVPWAEARRALGAGLVRATFAAGVAVFGG
jgi:predicted amidohydrolase YtcJ